MIEVLVTLLRVLLTLTFFVRIVHVTSFATNLATSTLLEQLLKTSHDQVEMILDTGWAHFVSDVPDALEHLFNHFLRILVREQFLEVRE